ncbi:hypothetical protein [Paludibaculum fermentans]|uniref:hypothetical protein n=1 Tax=Paludibaculum fermentans TaxID=1473598 RepID=UPI003EBE3D52
MKLIRTFTLTAALILAGLIIFSAPVKAQPKASSGAIFTTLGDGTAVNHNQYSSTCAVFLDGGPGPNAPAHAAGLDDGEYYFQVTDPSGKTLLSTDVVANRRFRVQNGVIVAYTGVGGPVHPIGLDQDHPELGAITIRLANATCPTDFAPTPNNGGAYKVWATPVISFVGDPNLVDNSCGNGCFHGFMPSASKSDNFKAKNDAATFCLSVEKQLQFMDGHTGIGAGWLFNVTDPLGVVNAYFTDDNGILNICGLAAGAYTVAEDANSQIRGLVVNGVEQPLSTTLSFTWTTGQPAPVILFQNLYGNPF